MQLFDRIQPTPSSENAMRPVQSTVPALNKIFGRNSNLTNSTSLDLFANRNYIDSFFNETGSRMKKLLFLLTLLLTSFASGAAFPEKSIALVVGFPAGSAPDEADLPGRSLIDLATRPDIERTAFSEYHAVGSPAAAFMVARGRYKYHHYVGYEPELFDLEDDPEEAHDLARSGAHVAVRDEFAQRLRAIVDPVMADRRAKDDQNLLVERFGGRAVALGLGKIGATPVPQVAP